MIFGPIADVAREKLAREEPDLFELASMFMNYLYADQYKRSCCENCVLYKPVLLFPRERAERCGNRPAEFRNHPSSHHQADHRQSEHRSFHQFHDFQIT